MKLFFLGMGTTFLIELLLSLGLWGFMWWRYYDDSYEYDLHVSDEE